MILADVITEVRRLSLDTNTNPDLQRFSDAELLGFANQTLRTMALVRPDLFSYIGEITCTAGEVLQSMPSDSIRLIEIFRIKDGDSVRETNRKILDETYPGWTKATAAACTSWMRHPRNPNKFFVYPKSTSGQILIGEYAQSPTEYAANDTIALLSDAFLPCVVYGTMFLSQSVDDEHVSSQRAGLFQKMFFDTLGAQKDTPAYMDVDSGVLKPEKLP